MLSMISMQGSFGFGIMGGGNILQQAMSMAGGIQSATGTFAGAFAGVSQAGAFAGAFSMDQAGFSPEAMAGSSVSSFYHPLMGGGMGFGIPNMGMTNGMGMVPGMIPSCCPGGIQNPQQQMMMQQMMMLLMMMMQMLQQQMGMNGMGMPGMGMSGGFGFQIGMGMPGMPGMYGSGFGYPPAFNMPTGILPGGMPGGYAPSYPAPGAAAPGAPAGTIGGPVMPFSGQSVKPLNNYRVTSEFGPRWGRMHKGIDLAAPTGTPVKAVADGVVTRIANDPKGYGNWVEIKHTNGTTTRYAHLSAFGNIRQGQRVGAGTVIGAVGSTGHSTGPHLHFEARDANGNAVNPRQMFKF